MHAHRAVAPVLRARGAAQGARAPRGGPPGDHGRGVGRPPGRAAGRARRLAQAGGMVDAPGAARTARVRPRRGRDAAGRHDASLLLPSGSAEHEYRETDAADVARGVQESTAARRGVRCREVGPRYGSSRESRDRFCATRTPSIAIIPIASSASDTLATMYRVGPGALIASAAWTAIRMIRTSVGPSRPKASRNTPK